MVSGFEAAFEQVHRSRWSRFMRATIELIGLPRTRESAVASEAFNLDWGSRYINFGRKKRGLDAFLERYRL